MIDFLVIFKNVFLIIVFPLIFTFFILYNWQDNQSLKKNRLIQLIGLIATIAISLLIFFIPNSELLIESITESWIGWFWNVFRTIGVIVLALLGFIKYRKKEKSSKKIDLFFMIGVIISMFIIVYLSLFL